jgi:hypothetical protein
MTSAVSARRKTKHVKVKELSQDLAPSCFFLFAKRIRGKQPGSTCGASLPTSQAAPASNVSVDHFLLPIRASMLRMPKKAAVSSEDSASRRSCCTVAAARRIIFLT